jgi:hypothetical protein
MTEIKNRGKDPALDSMIETIGRQIPIALEKSFDDVVLLLRMTKLALQTKKHEILDDELKAFCAALLDCITPVPQNSDQRLIDRSPAGLRGLTMLDINRVRSREIQDSIGPLIRVPDRAGFRKRARVTTARSRANSAAHSNKGR